MKKYLPIFLLFFAIMLNSCSDSASIDDNALVKFTELYKPNTLFQFERKIFDKDGNQLGATVNEELSVTSMTKLDNNSYSADFRFISDKDEYTYNARFSEDKVEFLSCTGPLVEYDGFCLCECFEKTWITIVDDKTNTWTHESNDLIDSIPSVLDNKIIQVLYGRKNFYEGSKGSTYNQKIGNIDYSIKVFKLNTVLNETIKNKEEITFTNGSKVRYHKIDSEFHVTPSLGFTLFKSKVTFDVGHSDSTIVIERRLTGSMILD